MKRIFIFFGVLALAIGGQAQMNQHSNYIGLNVGGGLNTLMYNPTNGTWNPKLGFLGELKYMHFFGKNFGLGIGAQFNYARSGATFNWLEKTDRLNHPSASNLQYESRTMYNDWKESQTGMILSIPVELFLRAPMGERWAFLFGLGAQFDLPLKGSFKADDGSYEVRGYFPSTGVEYSNLPAYGFTVHNADHDGDIKDLKSFGVSVIADLGFNYAMSNHWGLYFGLYGGYGFTNILDKASTDPILSAPDGTTTVNVYNGVVNSNQIDELHLLNAGVKIGINFGWNCHDGNNTGDDNDNNNNALVPYDNGAAYGGISEEEEAARKAEEEAANEARCNARRMNNPDMAQAMANIESDIADAEQAANESGNNAAKSAVADAKARAAAAKEAHAKGEYCKAYDLFNEAYGRIADSYAADAREYAKQKKNDIAKQAAEDADLYAVASHNDGLDCAIAASRNAKINSEIARDSDNPNRGSNNAYTNPNGANQAAPAVNQAAAGKPADRKQLQSLLDLINATVHFEFAKTEPLFDAATDLAINTLCNAMASDNSVKVLVTGHTDNIGSAAGNMTYGQKRAEALKALMVKRGAPAANIATASRGEEEPVVENDTDEHRYMNRRAVITLK